MIRHLDLFSGIGGFAYAADQVWGDVEHIFCDNDKFCQQVLNKHWKGSKIYDDIRKVGSLQRIDILTGGFPCQPFSQAGRRQGTDDDRYLWPEMLRVIQLTKPSWVIAENVRGLLTMQQGLVFEQVCSDLENEGYEVQPFVIPAVAVNAPHRRDRIWFVAHAIDHRPRQEINSINAKTDGISEVNRQEHSPTWKPLGTVSNGRGQGYVADSDSVNEERLESEGTGTGQPKVPSSDSDRNAEDPRGVGSDRRSDGDSSGHDREIQDARSSNSRLGWERSWLQVAAEFCSVDDGLPVELDGFKLTKAQHRAEQLKAYGNAIVPEVAMEIMKGMIL